MNGAYFPLPFFLFFRLFLIIILIMLYRELRMLTWRDGHVKQVRSDTRRKVKFVRLRQKERQMVVTRVFTK